MKEKNGKTLELWLSALTGLSLGGFCVISMMNTSKVLPFKELSPIYICFVLVFLCWRKSGFQSTHLKEFMKFKGSFLAISWQAFSGLVVFIGLHFTHFIEIKNPLSPIEYTLVRSLGAISGALSVHFFLGLIYNDLVDHFPEHHLKRFLDYPILGWCCGFVSLQWFFLVKVVS